MVQIQHLIIDKEYCFRTRYNYLHLVFYLKAAALRGYPIAIH